MKKQFFFISLDWYEFLCLVIYICFCFCRLLNSVIRNERHPTNSEDVIYFFEAYSDQTRCSKRKILQRQIEETCGDSKITMQATKCIKTCNAVTPFKYYTRSQMCLSELSSMHPDGVINKSDDPAKSTLGAFVLHKKAVWRKSYVSVTQISQSKEKVSHIVCCFIERIDRDSNNSQVHEQANFLIESFKAHPVSGKYLQGLTIYKNTQTDYETVHFPDTIIEFAIVPKSGKYFAALLRDFCTDCKTAKVSFGVYKRKQLLTSPEWV